MTEMKLPQPTRNGIKWRWTKSDDEALTYLYLNYFKEVNDIVSMSGGTLTSCAIDSRIRKLGLRQRKMECVTPEMDAIIRKECRIKGRTTVVSQMLGMSEQRLAEYIRNNNIPQVVMCKKLREIIEKPGMTDEEIEQNFIKYYEDNASTKNIYGLNKDYLFDIEIETCEGWEWYGCVGVPDVRKSDSKSDDPKEYNKEYDDMIDIAEQRARIDFWQLRYKHWRLSPNNRPKEKKYIVRTFRPLENVTPQELANIVSKRRYEREHKSRETYANAIKKHRKFIEAMTADERKLWREAQRIRADNNKNCRDSDVTTKDIYLQLKKNSEREDKNIIV